MPILHIKKLRYRVIKYLSQDHIVSNWQIHNSKPDLSYSKVQKSNHYTELFIELYYIYFIVIYILYIHILQRLNTSYSIHQMEELEFTLSFSE